MSLVVRVVSAIAGIALVSSSFMIAAAGLGALPSKNGPFTWLLALAPLPSLVVLGTWMLAPRGYSLDTRGIMVLRPCGDVMLPSETFQSVELPTDSGEARPLLRLFGSGGLFGVFGLYWNRRLGHFTLYGSRAGNYVIIRRTGGERPVVLTPDEPEEFVSHARQVFGQT